MDNIINMKRRLTIVAWIMGVLIVILSGTLIGVLAASSHGWGSNFSISYDIGENVAMKLRYKVDGEVQSIYPSNPADSPVNAYEQEENGFMDFDTSVTNAQLYFDNSDISEKLQLSPDKPTLTIEFDIVNISTTSPLYVYWDNCITFSENINLWLSIWLSYVKIGKDMNRRREGVIQFVSDQI